MMDGLTAGGGRESGKRVWRRAKHGIEKFGSRSLYERFQAVSS